MCENEPLVFLLGKSMRFRNILLLTVCQLISATGSFVLVILGGIIGSKLSGNPALATLPVSIMVVCVASTTVPASMLMRSIGRRRSFALAALSSFLAMILATFAVLAASFAGFVLAAGLFGVNLAFTQQYRFAAAESVEKAFTARAISFVLLGAIGGAFLAPELIRFGEHWLADVQYAGTLVVLAGLYLLQAFLFLFLGPLRGEQKDESRDSPRPLIEIIRKPVFIVAVLGGTTAYGVMTLVMTATPLSMHVNDGYSLEQTANVIRSHVLAMYLPSLFSGFLLERIGIAKLMTAGTVGLLLSCIVALQNQTMVHYSLALVLLGVGWNFLYVGGTTMLTLSYRMSERFKAQAVNEFCVFGTSAASSLLAGVVIHLYGWYSLVLVPVPLLFIMLAGLFLVRGDEQLRRSAPAAV